MLASQTQTDFEPRIWIGSWHLYNNGYLIGEWFDVGEYDTAEEITDKIKEYIKANLPSDIDYDSAVDELWCFDNEYLEGESSICEAVKEAQAMYELINEGYDYELVQAVEDKDSLSDWCMLDDDGDRWQSLAVSTGQWDIVEETAGNAIACCVDWERYYAFQVEFISTQSATYYRFG